MKRLIVLCDGTGQSSYRGSDGQYPTNVKNFSDCLAQTYTVGDSPEEHPQIIYYQSGVGTSTVLGVTKNLAKGLGFGIDDNILDAYYFLCSNYHEADGDEIFIFGFSRGAFTARILANLVVRLGLLHMNVSWMIRRAWAQYQVVDNSASFDFFLDKLDTSKFKERTRHVKVKVLGVWDTVGAIGLPDYEVVETKDTTPDTTHGFYDSRLHWGIENVFHALALDELRLPFGPTLFYQPHPDKKAPWIQREELGLPEDRKIKMNLKQCWFAGAHTDIGGGYPSSHQSSITLAWMIDACLRLNLLKFNASIDWTARTLGRKWKKIINAHHRPQDNKYGSHIATDRAAGKVESSYPGWGCGIITDSYKEVGLFAPAIGWQYRAPGNYTTLGEHPGAKGPVPKFQAVKDAFSWLIPGGKSSTPSAAEPERCEDPSCKHPLQTNRWQQPEGTNETIHASVYARFLAQKNGQAMKVAEWNPVSLSGFRVDATGKATVDIRRKPCSPEEAPYKFKWVGACMVHKDKVFEMYEEPDDDYPDGLMQQLRVRDNKFWETDPGPIPEVDEYRVWLAKGFNLQKFKADPKNYKPPEE